MKQKIKNIFSGIWGFLCLIFFLLLILVLAFYFWITKLVREKIVKRFAPDLYKRVKENISAKEEKSNKELDIRTAGQGWAFQKNIFH